MNRKSAKSGDVTSKIDSKNEEGKSNAGFFGSKTFAIFAMAAGFCGASAAIVGKLTFSGWNHSGPVFYEFIFIVKLEEKSKLILSNFELSFENKSFSIQQLFGIQFLHENSRKNTIRTEKIFFF